MSISPPPPRTSTPETVETTIRSFSPAKNPSDALSSRPSSEILGDKEGVPNTKSMPSQPKPRRFLPQPIEESTRSSRRKNAEHGHRPPDLEDSSQDRDDKPPSSHSDEPPLSGGRDKQTPSTPRRFKPEPVETSTRSSRRKFAPEPIETSTRKSKDKPGSHENEAESKPRRKFAPQPVETTTRSSKPKKAHQQREDDTETTPRPRRKFVPEPIETTTTTRQRRKPERRDSDEDTEPPGSGISPTSSRESSGPRKFSPELLETAKGSYRRVHLPSPKAKSPPPTEPTPTPDEEETEDADEVAGLEESKFSAAALARKHPEVTRQHSFIVPDLPMIESTTEDESSDTPSLSDSPSSLDTTENKRSINPPDPAESYTDYVLRLAAETVTEKELQEQAMAAYINERPHEPVDHFAISHDDEEDGPLPVPMFQGEKGVDVKTFRRSSAAELDLEMANMRKHHEQLENAKRELKADTAGQSRFSAAALATRHALEAKAAKKTKKVRADEDSELARMRAAASPPMLGANLVFPYTISPKMTRCDPDQAPRPRNADSDDEAPTPQSPHLWRTDKKAGNNGGEGLWMGLCQASQFQPSNVQNGLRSGIQTPVPQTPAMEKNNPFESALSARGSQTPGRGNQTPGRKRPFSGLGFMPLTPPRSQDGDDVFTSTIDRKLQLENQIEEEFPTRVITQIYNYLSLGYPSLAHMFDEELSKISRISIEELRKDDYNVDAKGYIGAPEGDGVDESEVVGKCKRWEALRLYIKEWARQSPNFADDRSRPVGANEDWGARARKGSWGN